MPEEEANGHRLPVGVGLGLRVRVRFTLPLTLTLSLARRRKLTDIACPLAAAACSGVASELLRASMSAPSERSHAMVEWLSPG